MTWSCYPYKYKSFVYDFLELFLLFVALEGNARIEAIGRALAELPHAHYATLKYLITHLDRYLYIFNILL